MNLVLKCLNTRARRLKTGLACLVRARAGRLLNVCEGVRFIKTAVALQKMNLQLRRSSYKLAPANQIGPVSDWMVI